MQRLRVQTREIRRLAESPLDFYTRNKHLITPSNKVKTLQEGMKKALGLLGKKGIPLSPTIKETAQRIFDLTNSLITAMQEYSPGKPASAKKILARGRFLSIDAEMQQIIQMSESWIQETKNVAALISVARPYMPPERYGRIRADLIDLLDSYKSFNKDLKASA